jgi:hypothetical protein
LILRRSVVSLIIGLVLINSTEGAKTAA